MKKNKKDGKGGAQPALSGLAAAFASAGLISRQDAERAERQKRSLERREEKALGRSAKQARDEQEREALQEQRRAQAEADRARAKQRLEGEARANAVKLIKRGRIDGGGPKRWFFVARNGQVPFVGVSDATTDALAKGAAGIVESLEAFDARHVIVDRNVLGELKKLDEAIVRFWNR